VKDRGNFGAEGVSEATSLAGVKVMVIDDSNTIRRSAEIFWCKAGCKSSSPKTGFDALAKITDHQPDIIFVDIMMPLQRRFIRWINTLRNCGKLQS